MTLVVAAAAAALALLVVRPPTTAPAHRLTSAAGSAAGAGGRGAPWTVVAVVATAATLVAVRASPLLAAVVVLGSAAGAVGVRRHRRRRTASTRAAACVEVVHALAAELRAGHPPAQALAIAALAAGPLTGPLGDAARAARLGGAVPEELRRLSALPGAEPLAAVAAAWDVTEQAGGPVAAVLERVGDSLDQAAQDARALGAALAGPRATMTLLAALPLMAVVLGESAGAHPIRLLTGQPLGWGLAAGAAVLDLLGVVWVRRLTGHALRA